MAQRHVLMMLAAAATSFLDGESDRTETGSAKCDRDESRPAARDESRRGHSWNGFGTDSGCHRAVNRARHRECRVTGVVAFRAVINQQEIDMTHAYKRTTLLAAILAGTALATAGCGDR